MDSPQVFLMGENQLFINSEMQVKLLYLKSKKSYNVINSTFPQLL